MRDEWRVSVSDDEFLASFENCTLAGGSFHHADHVRMAFLYLFRYAALEAIQRLFDLLARFAAANGKPERYNETITWALLLLIRERMVRAGGQPDWAEFGAGDCGPLNWENN